MLFREFSQSLEKLERTPSRLEMMYQLADLFGALNEKEMAKASYLMQGTLVPLYFSLEFQLSVKMVIKALARVNSGAKKLEAQVVVTNLFETVEPEYKDLHLDEEIKIITRRYKKNGDIGNITEEIISEYFKVVKLTKNLSIEEVYQELSDIALDSGNGSQERKVEKLSKLLMNLDEVSAKFVSRIVIGKLRLGFSAMTILDALSWSVVGSKAHRNLLENAYQKRADVGELAKSYIKTARELDKNDSNFLKILAKRFEDEYSVKVGIPVIPALCQRLNSSEEIIEKMGRVIVEPKYDGLRIQIHYSKDGLKILENVDSANNIKAFTRSLEDVTHMFPELKIVATSLNCENCILDAEAIGYQKESGNLLPFQETITRKRKHLVAEQSKKVPIRFYVFDCLYLNDKSLLEVKLHDRKELLRSIFLDNETISYTKSIETADPKMLRDFHGKQLGSGLEGAVMKQINSHYKSGRKGWQWVKIKEEEGTSGKLKDTLDLVVMGYYAGKGKRSQFGVGAFLVGVLNDKQELKTIAKIGTGLTDKQFVELKNRVDLLETDHKPENYEVEKSLFPDVWVSPELVVEIAADEITKSPSHTAGVALRFPRLIRFRDDKNWIDATTIEELENF
ncbi:MAG: ATP-dependent DNA ligase [Pseudomonadales bacterium]|nr:ATP-dependent DNA ligase [Pseudomonadales bacterium]